MKKNSPEIFEFIGIDPITNHYSINIPEEIMNQLEWYEDTKIQFMIEGNDLILTERS